MKEEIYLFIIWKNALYKKEEIIIDMKKKFTILNMYNVNWSDEKYSENLSRFYGTSLPKGCDKETHCGKGEFLLIIVKDNNPKFGYRKTTAGEAYVNTNMFDCKVLYRNWTGGGHKIHCSNTIQETNHDLTLLMGKNIEDYMKEYKKNKKIFTINNDLLGSNGFDSVSQMFYALNNCTNYAILRNYEILPDDIYVNEHNDIDLICESKENTAYVLNAQKAQDLDYRVQYYVKVEDKIANFDLRYLGDKYYDEYLEKDILSRRIWNDKGFYTLNSEDYFYTLLYHALVHKYVFADDYKMRLKKMNSKFTDEVSNDNKKSAEMLSDWLIKNEYISERPFDQTVYYNLDNVKYFSRLVYREDKEKVMLENEVKILKEKIEQIEFSRTWKYTEFIRKINAKLKK